MLGVGLALATTVAGLFGMNLTSGLEEHPTLFWTTSAASVSLAAAVYLGTWAHVGRLGRAIAANQRLQALQAVSAVSDA